MKRKADPIAPRLLYGLLTGIVTWYAYVVPISLTGYWRNLLVPGTGMFTNFVHVYLIVAIWAFTRSRRATLISTGAVMALTTTATFALGAAPTLDMIGRFGMFVYVLDWIMPIMQTVVAPAIAAFLLLRADRIAPKVVKEWTPVHA